MANPSILPIGIDGSVEQNLAVPSSLTRRGLVALAAVTALTLLSGQVGAETPAVSAIASASKGEGVGQVTSDGKAFSTLTEKEVKGLADAEYDKYQEWKIIQKKATIIGIKEERKDVQATVIGIKEERKDVQATVIAEYEIMINNFIALAKSGNTGEKIYLEMKGKLKRVLDSGKPPELIARLEPIRQLLA